MTEQTRSPGPIPQGKYVLAKRHGDLVFTAGMTPRERGKLVHEGRVRADTPIGEYQHAAVFACSNALHAARSVVGENERICDVLAMTVYIASATDFTAHSQLADFASDYLAENIGAAGRCARTTIGVASLPGGAPIEIQLTVSVRAPAGTRTSDPAL
ncbi:MAG: RidA family protein [Proteobacteria bacterium]|nr:RidA family protein [Pseudomonadota bacterium]